MDTDFLVYRFGLIAVLIFCSGFLSGSETAIFSLSGATVRRLGNSGSRAGAMIRQLRENPRVLLITILLGNVAVNVFAASTMTNTMEYILSHGGGADWSDRVGASTGLSRDELGGAISLVSMTALLLFLGEATPKTLALSMGESLALRVAPIIYVWNRILFASGLGKLVLLVADGVMALFRGGWDEELTPQEKRTAIHVGHLAGELGKQERDMLHGALGVRTKPVEFLMRPRNDMVTVPIEMPINSIALHMRRKAVSRVPVWEDNEENIVGILHVRNLLVHRANIRTPEDLKGILAKPLFVPETKSAVELLREFRQGETHLAVVVDEYGGISGLVTFEDILEEIVGEIWDQGQLLAPYQLEADGRARISGRLALGEFARRFGVDLPMEEVATVGGYVINHIRRIPHVGERLTIDGLIFQVTAADPNCIRELVVWRVPEYAEKGAGS